MRKRRLAKSGTNVIITGTLGGIAEYFGIDATIVRLIYVLLSFGLIGSPIILYIIMALLIPSADRSNHNSYGNNNPYYRDNHYNKTEQKRERKQAEKVDDDDWSDF